MPRSPSDDRPRCHTCRRPGRPYARRDLYQRDDCTYCATHLLERLLAEGTIVMLPEHTPEAMRV